MDVHGLYSFFDLFRVKPDMYGPAFSKAKFGVGTIFRLIALNTRYLVRKRTKINVFSKK